jgi:hypothetical protein
VGFFAVANTFFPVIHVSLENPYGDAARLLAYAGIFLPSYAMFGALLALYFDEAAQRIGRLYCFDLAGAASGCLLAPLVLTWAGLPPAIMTVLLGALALLAATPLARRRLAVGAGAAGFCVVALLAWRGSVFVEHPDVARLSRYALSDHARNGIEEVRVRWNDLARTSLVRADVGNPNANAEAWGIVQDDGISNVKVARWDPAAKPADILPGSLHHALPFVMGHEPKRILVLFAGVGRDMVELDGMAQGQADITGVELNPAVADLWRDPLLADMNLRAFHARPNMHLVVREGRDFLDNDRGRYDLVFVATNGSTNAARTGHTRKYLDTYEAMASYLDHLARSPGSMIVFANQARDPQGREPCGCCSPSAASATSGRRSSRSAPPRPAGKTAWSSSRAGSRATRSRASSARWRRGRTRGRCSTRPRAWASRASWTPSWGVRAGRSSPTIARSCTR